MVGRISVSLMALALAGCGSDSTVGAEPAADDAAAAPGQELALQAYRGMCDASAAVMLDASTFVVANDERPQLYSRLVVKPPHKRAEE